MALLSNLDGTNLLGGSFKEYVSSQIYLRQQILGNPQKSNANIVWENSKTAFVNLFSSVNLENSDITTISSSIVPTPSSPDTFIEFSDTEGIKHGSQRTYADFDLNSINQEGEIYSSDPNQYQSTSKYETLSSRIQYNEEITPGSQAYTRLRQLGADDPDYYMDNTLANSWGLSNGTDKSRTGIIDFTSGDYTFTQRSYPKDSSSLVWGVHAYSPNGAGLKPMPGITSFNVKDRNMGSLREATITIRANDEYQFKMIDTLYCRIGYTMFLEWGNSIYYTNEGEYQSRNTYSLEFEFVYQTSVDDYLIEQLKDTSNVEIKEEEYGYNTANFKDPSVFQKVIEIQRKRSCGNYDGFFGRVKNFSWEFNKEGYYEITLSLITWGDMIESLTIDGIYGESAPQAEGSIQPQKNNTSALTTFLSIAASPSGTSTTTKSTSYSDSGGALEVNENTSTRKTYSNYKTTLVGNLTETTKETSILDSPSDPNTSNTSTLAVESDVSTHLDYTRLPTSVGKIISAHAFFGDQHYYYIRFGDILDFIKDRLLIYNSEDSQPIVDIDTDTDTNFCYSTGINVSADPSKVMISAHLPFTTSQLGNLKEKKNEDNETSSRYDTNTNRIWQYVDAQLEPFNDNSLISGNVLGKIMNIYFEYQYLLDTIQSLRNEQTGKLSLYNFINGLLQTANSCLGGVNKLTIRIKEGNILQIYDQNPIYGTEPLAGGSTIINLFGIDNNKGSFVTDFKIKTELSNDFSTTVAVGAQANAAVVGEDSTALSRWNYGLVDRWYPQKIDSLKKDNNLQTITPETRLRTITLQLRDLWLGYSEGKLDELIKVDYTPQSGQSRDDITTVRDVNVYYFKHFATDSYEEFVKLQKDFFQALIAYKVELTHSSQIASNQIGMIPINIQITMDGLSGIRIYDQLPLDTRFLPKYYPQTLNWIIKGVSHEVINNKWHTKLDTIAVPKLPLTFNLSTITYDNLSNELTQLLNANGSTQATDEERNTTDYAPYLYRQVTVTTKTEFGNHPNATQKAQMIRLIKEIMNPIAQHFGGEKVVINSMFRSRAVNEAIGGSSTSQHMYGEAVDIGGIVGKNTSLSEIYEWAANNLTYGQLIWELGTDNDPQWIHISLGTKKEKLRYLGNNNYKSCNSKGQV